MHLLSPCSYTDKQRLCTLLSDLYKAIDAIEDKSLTFGDLLNTDLAISALVQAILKLCKVQMHWVSDDHIWTFLMPHGEGEDASKLGIIAEINGLSLEAVGRITPEQAAVEHYKLLASLYALDKDLASVNAMLNDLPADCLVGMQEQLAKLTDPDYAIKQGKDKAKQDIRDLIRRQNEEASSDE